MTDVNTEGSSLPPEADILAVIRPVLRSLVVAHTFLTLLVPLFFALLRYSTAHSRRQPVFILNVMTLLVAFALGTIADVAGISTILEPLQALPPTVYIAIGAIGIFQSLLVDLTLLMRLIVVYSVGRVGPRRFALIMFIPIVLKVARVINVSILLRFSTDALASWSSGTSNYSPYFTSPYLKVEWAAQIVDNAYASIMFLRSIGGRMTVRERFGSHSFMTIESSLAYRLRTLFRIALSNFVIPTLFSIVLLVVSFYDTNGDYIGDIVYVNSMVSAFGIVFATVWVGVEGRRDEKEREQLNLEFYQANRSTNHTLGGGTPSSAAEVVVGGAHVQDVESAEREASEPLDLSDMDVRHPFALIRYMKQED